MDLIMTYKILHDVVSPDKNKIISTITILGAWTKIYKHRCNTRLVFHKESTMVWTCYPTILLLC